MLVKFYGYIQLVTAAAIYWPLIKAIMSICAIYFARHYFCIQKLEIGRERDSLQI